MVLFFSVCSTGWLEISGTTGLNICAHYHILFIVVLVSASLKVGRVKTDCLDTSADFVCGAGT